MHYKKMKPIKTTLIATLICSIACLFFSFINGEIKPHVEKGLQIKNKKVSVHPIIGTWKIVSFKYGGKDGIDAGDSSSKMKSVKIITPTHFSFVSMSMPDNKFLCAATGSCKFDKDTYTEQIGYTSMQGMEGKQFTYQIRFEGDKWYVNGPINKSGSFTLEEVWQRVK